MKATLAVTDEDLKQVLLESPFARIFNFRLYSFADGQCSLTVPFQKATERPGGIVAGSVFMTAADVAMWLAIMTRLGKDTMSVTTEMTTAFLNPAKQEDIECAARVLKFGKGLIYGVAECRNAGGKLLTHHTITYVRVGSRIEAEGAGVLP